MARVLDAMQADRIVDVRDLSFFQFCAAQDVHFFVLLVVAATVFVGPRVLRFHETSLDALHEAVRVHVIVNRRALTFRPAQDHYVELAIAGVDEISRVPIRLKVRVRRPFLHRALVIVHNRVHVVDVHFIGGEGLMDEFD